MTYTARRKEYKTRKSMPVGVVAFVWRSRSGLRVTQEFMRLVIDSWCSTASVAALLTVHLKDSFSRCYQISDRLGDVWPPIKCRCKCLLLGFYFVYL